MTKREITISLMRVAGYHSDQRKRVELLVAGRVNRQLLDEAWAQGTRAKQNGVRCNCWECRQGQGQGQEGGA